MLASCQPQQEEAGKALRPVGLGFGRAIRVQRDLQRDAHFGAMRHNENACSAPLDQPGDRGMRHGDKAAGFRDEADPIITDEESLKAVSPGEREQSLGEMGFSGF